MRASFLALLLLSACDFSCELEPIDPFAPDYFGDGLIVHRPALREGVFSARAETRVRLYFAGLENSYADRAVYAVTPALGEQLELDRVDDSHFESDDATYVEGAQLSFIAFTGAESHAGHIIAPSAVSVGFDVETGSLNDEAFFELYRARPPEYPELVYEHMPESSASARNRARVVPRSKYEAAGHYALVVYAFTHRSHNADPEWQLSAGTGSPIYFEVTE